MSNRPTIIITTKNGLQLFNWSELADYKDLLYFLVVRGLKARYAQSVLGVGWAVIQPVVTMLIFTLIFGRLAKIDSGGVPYALFSFCGLMAWTYFSGAINEASNSLTTNANMISKVYFPRLILPLSALLAKLLDFIVTIILMIILMIVFKFAPSSQIVYFPLMAVLLFLTSFGLSILLAAWSVQYRDVKYAMTFVIQLFMYASPVVYPLSIIPEKYRLVYSLNPMVGVIEGFRASILGASTMPWSVIVTSGSVTLVMLLFGLFVFSKMEKTFADVV